jgi:hypothetical protein
MFLLSHYKIIRKKSKTIKNKKASLAPNPPLGDKEARVKNLSLFVSISLKMVQTISSYLFSVYKATLNYENLD